jgi:small-conductance mechanosensitive channel
VLFIEDNRPITTEVVRLSFEFAKAAARLEPNSSMAAKPVPPTESSLKFLITAKAKIDANIKQSQSQLKAALEAKPANFKEMKKVQDERTDLARRIQILSSISTYYKNLLASAPATSGTQGGAQSNMASLVDSLERSLPELSMPVGAQVNATANEGARSPNGIVRIIGRVSALSSKGRLVDSVIRRTDRLDKSAEELRDIVRDSLHHEFDTLTLDSSDLDVLAKQQERMEDLSSQVIRLAPILSGLSKQQTLLTLYQSHLADWRSDIRADLETAWRDLLTRAGMLLIALLLLIGIGMIGRRLTDKHVHDANARKMFVAGERVLLWLIGLILVLISFAFDLSSLATFFGLLAAGLAVGLHDVFLSVGGYMLMVYRFRVRPGDPVEICGISGEVRKIGLIDFELSELDKSTGERTGRVVSFSNSCVFTAPAIPLFRNRAAAPVGVRRA